MKALHRSSHQDWASTRSRLGRWALVIFQRGFVLLILFCFPSRANARLGGAEGQIEQDRIALHFTQKAQTQTQALYRYNVFSSPDLVVKEYVNPKNKLVFGVSWRGSRMPDLRVLLGFDPATLKGSGGIRSLHYRRVQTQTLLVEIESHTGFYVGHAIRTDLLPSGVSPSEVAP